jgi:hypothetical protein
MIVSLPASRRYPCSLAFRDASPRSCANTRHAQGARLIKVQANLRMTASTNCIFTLHSHQKDSSPGTITRTNPMTKAVEVLASVGRRRR